MDTRIPETIGELPTRREQAENRFLSANPGLHGGPHVAIAGDALVSPRVLASRAQQADFL